MQPQKPAQNSLCRADFEWFTPQPKKAELAITIPNNHCFNLNPSLRAKIPQKIEIGVGHGGTILWLQPHDTGYKIAKSGTLKDSLLIGSIKRSGVRLPARYVVEEFDGGWVANLVPPAKPPLPTKIPKRPKKKGLNAILAQKEEAL